MSADIEDHGAAVSPVSKSKIDRGFRRRAILGAAILLSGLASAPARAAEVPCVLDKCLGLKPDTPAPASDAAPRAATAPG